MASYDAPTDRRDGVSWGRLLWVGPLTVVVALLVNLALKTLLQALNPSLTEMGQLGRPLIMLTVQGAILAVLVFALLVWLVPHPIRWFRIVAVIALLISLVPDLLLGLGGDLRRMGTAMMSPFFRVGALLIVSLFTLAGAPVTAHDATPVATAGHPVVGAWWASNDAPGADVSTAAAIFHADGTYLEIDPNIGADVGVWRATGSRTADLTADYQDIDPDPAVAAPGTVTVHKSVRVDETGTGFTARLTVEVRIPDGTVVFTARYGGEGARLELGSTPLLGTPVAGTPMP